MAEELDPSAWEVPEGSNLSENDRAVAEAREKVSRRIQRAAASINGDEFEDTEAEIHSHLQNVAAMLTAPLLSSKENLAQIQIGSALLLAEVTQNILKQISNSPSGELPLPTLRPDWPTRLVGLDQSTVLSCLILMLEEVMEPGSTPTTGKNDNGDPKVTLRHKTKTKDASELMRSLSKIHGVKAGYDTQGPTATINFRECS